MQRDKEFNNILVLLDFFVFYYFFEERKNKKWKITQKWVITIYIYIYIM